MQFLIWQALLLVLWGVPTLIFVPVLLRSADTEMMATILVAQVYANYLALVVQFGFPWSGPAAVAKARSSDESYGFWHQSVRVKICIFALTTSGVAAAICFWHEYYVLAYGLPLFAQALNSNWFLQAKGNYKSGVLFSFFGVCAGGLLVASQHVMGSSDSLEGVQIISALMMPQILMGIGTYWMARRRLPCDFKEGSNPKLSLSALNTDIFFVSSQLLLLASSSIGTVMIGFFGDASITAAYAATEKIFNLGANGLIGLFMGIYPKLAHSYYIGKDRYVRNVKRILIGTTTFSGGVLLIIFISGQYWFELYLGPALAQLVQPVLIPLAVWLMLCISQHLLTAHLVLTDRRSMVLWVQGGVLFTTLLVGVGAMSINPLFWVYGMICGQLLAIAILLRLYLKSAWYGAR